MTVNNAIQGVRRLFLDTAPIIYYVENRNRSGGDRKKEIDVEKGN